MVTYRLTFSKTGRARWLGHLDVMRAFERAFRRSGIPVALSQGHNPRPRMRFVFPSAVGMTARADILYVDVDADEHTDPGIGKHDISSPPTWLADLTATLPDGLSVNSAEPVPENQRKVDLASYNVAHYRIGFRCSALLETSRVEQILRELVAQGQPSVVRRGDGSARHVDVRRHLLDMRWARPEPEQLEVYLTSRFGQEGTLRPFDLAAILEERVPGLELQSVERLCLDKERQEPRTDPTVVIGVCTT